MRRKMRESGRDPTTSQSQACMRPRETHVCAPEGREQMSMAALLLMEALEIIS